MINPTPVQATTLRMSQDLYQFNWDKTTVKDVVLGVMDVHNLNAEDEGLFEYLFDIVEDEFTNIDNLL